MHVLAQDINKNNKHRKSLTKQLKARYTMNNSIRISFDDDINSYIVILPELVTLKMLIQSKTDFENLILSNPHRDKFSLLFDTGLHEFESIECLKYLRTFLSIKPLIDNCHKYASVAPENYAQAEIKSDKEASFNKYSDAYAWLNPNKK